MTIKILANLYKPKQKEYLAKLKEYFNVYPLEIYCGNSFVDVEFPMPGYDVVVAYSLEDKDSGFSPLQFLGLLFADIRDQFAKLYDTI